MGPRDGHFSEGDHVLMVTSSWPRFRGDYAGSFVEGFARCLLGGGREVTVVRPDHAPGRAGKEHPSAGGGGEDGVALDLRELRVRYHLLREWQNLFYGAGAPENLEANPALFLQAIPFALNLWRILSREIHGKTHLISHWLVPAALLAGPVARSGGVPHLAVAHSSDVALLERLAHYPMGRQLVRRVLGYVDVLWVTGAHLQDRLAALVDGARADQAPEGVLGGEPDQVDRGIIRLIREAVVMPMGVELKGAVQGGGPGSEGETLKLLVMGRLVPIKGVDLLLEAVALLRERADGNGDELVTVDVVGDGPEREALEELAGRLGVRARFWGTLTGAAKERVLAGADVMVIPSRVLNTGRREGTPLVLLEAFASGKPVIASKSGGMAEVLVDGVNGLLFEPGDVPSLADGIARLSRDGDLVARLGVNAQETGARFSWDQVSVVLEGALGRLEKPVRRGL